MTQTSPSIQVGAAEVRRQQTLKAAVTQFGVGLHSGETTQVRILPAAPDTGRFFVRTDLPGRPTIPATVDSVRQTTLSTELAVGDATVRTVEHLLAALVSLNIDNAQIEVSGPEIPLLDGSAQAWVEALQAEGNQPQSSHRHTIEVDRPVSVQENDAFVMAMPDSTARFTYGIDFDVAAIGNQWFSWSPAVESFSGAVAPARTFGLAHQIEYLRQQGLIKGGSLENALVCDRDRWLNPPLRFENEPVRHKLLDLLGDLSLLGALPVAHVIAYKASHALHVRFAKVLLGQTMAG